MFHSNEGEETMTQERQGLVSIGSVWQKADGSISGVINATIKRGCSFRMYPIKEEYRTGENSPNFTMKTDKSNVLELSDYDKKQEAKKASESQEDAGKEETSTSLLF